LLWTHGAAGDWSVDCVLLDPDGGGVVTAALAQRYGLARWDLVTGEQLAGYPLPGYIADSERSTEDGSVRVAVSRSGIGRVAPDLSGLRDAVDVPPELDLIRLVPGTRLAVARPDGGAHDVVLLDAAGGVRARFSAGARITEIAVSPDGGRVLAADADGRVH